MLWIAFPKSRRGWRKLVYTLRVRSLLMYIKKPLIEGALSLLLTVLTLFAAESLLYTLLYKLQSVIHHYVRHSLAI